MQSAEEAQYVRWARAGSQEAFGELVLATQTFAYNLALRALSDPIEAQDLVQEAYLRAWRGLASFRGEAGFRTWLYRIVLNLCLNRSKRFRRELAQLALEEETASPGVDRSMDPQARLEADELERRLRAEVERLPAAQRLLVMLRYQQDLSYDEISRVMDLPLGTVKTGLHRAHKRLRAALEDERGALEDERGALEDERGALKERTCYAG